MRHVRFVTLALLLAAAPGALEAQAITSPYRFVETRHSAGIFAGYLQTAPGRYDLAPHSAPIFGARYGIRFTGPLSGDVGLGISPTQRTLITRAAAGADDPLLSLGETDMVAVLAEAGLRFHFTGPRTWHGIAPYAVATVGLGGSIRGSDPREEGIDEDARFRFGPTFAAGAGLGTDVFLTERFSVRAEVKDHIWRLSYPIGVTDSGTRENQWRNNFSFTLGGSVHF